MSQPGRAGAPAPLRVASERLSEAEAAEARAAASPTGPVPVPPVPPPVSAAAAAPAAAPARPAPTAPVGAASAVPVLAPRSLPVLAPRPARRFGLLWRLVFARRRAGRHRPETTPPHSWSMVSPQRRRSGRRWGRR